MMGLRKLATVHKGGINGNFLHREMRILMDTEMDSYHNYGVAPEGMPEHMRLIYSVVPEYYENALVLIYENTFGNGNFWDIYVLEEISKNTFIETVYAKTNCFTKPALEQIFYELEAEGAKYCFDPNDLKMQYSEWIDKPEEYDPVTVKILSNGHWLEKNYDTKHRY